jgi:hypothetical protein
MRKLLLTAFFATVAIVLFAQRTKSGKKVAAESATSAKAKATWKRGGMVSLTLSQGGTRNWAPGGDRFTLASNGFLNLYSNYTKGRTHWDNTVDANYGLQNSSSNGVIKNDDKLDFITRLTHELGNKETRKFRYGGWFNFRTQFVDGYNYDNGERRRISDFLAPGIATLSLGADFYSKDQVFNVHAGPMMRWVLVANRPYELAANYGVNPDRQVKIEAGVMSSIAFKKEIIKNITWQSRLDLTSDFVDRDPANVDIFFTNMFYLKVNKCLGVVYNFDLQYDDDTKIFGYDNTRARTQLKSILGVGLSMKF